MIRGTVLFDPSRCAIAGHVLSVAASAVKACGVEMVLRMALGLYLLHAYCGMVGLAVAVWTAIDRANAIGFAGVSAMRTGHQSGHLSISHELSQTLAGHATKLTQVLLRTFRT